MQHSVIACVCANPGITVAGIVRRHPELTEHAIRKVLLWSRRAKLVRAVKTEKPGRPMGFYPADGTPDIPFRNVSVRGGPRGEAYYRLNAQLDALRAASVTSNGCEITLRFASEADAKAARKVLA